MSTTQSTGLEAKLLLELGRALHRWRWSPLPLLQQSASCEQDCGGVRRRPLPRRARPRHQRLAWLLWQQLRRRLLRRQQLLLRQRRRTASASVVNSACVWDGAPSAWPLSLTSDYHSDGRDTPGTSSARSGPPLGGDTLSGGATGGDLTSLSSAYSWDAEPSPRSLDSCRTAQHPRQCPAPAAAAGKSKALLESSRILRGSGRSGGGGRSDGTSSASWSSVHESDCECSLQAVHQSRSAKFAPGVRCSSVPKGRGAVRRRSVPERIHRRRLTHAQREGRRWSEVRWRRQRLDVWNMDTCRSTDDEMDPAPDWAGPASLQSHLRTPMSFSMSSLHQAGYHTPETTALRMRADRPYNSLCRKRKERWGADPGHRQSWGSEVSKDAFWQALQPNYAFLMEQQLIESCKEASGDLAWDCGDVPGMDSAWSLSELLEQYTELHQWLNQIQSAIYASPENITDRRLRESHNEEIQRKAYRRAMLADQSTRLQQRHPQMHDELQWRLAHLSSKWDTLLACVRPPSPSAAAADPDMAHIGPDLAHEVRCLEQWFRHMDGQLGPISFRLNLRSTQEAADRLTQYQALHDDVKSHHRIVSGVGRLCRQLADEGKKPEDSGKAEDTAKEEDAVKTEDTGRTEDGGRALEERAADRRRLLRLAARLDTSWQKIFLRAYEWCCHLEGILEEFKQGRLPRVEDGYSADEDEREPLTKVRRLTSSEADPAGAHSDAGSFFEDDYLPSADAMKVLQAPSCGSPSASPKKMEREILDIGYSSENSAQSSDSSDAAPQEPESGANAAVRRSAVNTSNVRCEIITADATGSADASSDDEPRSAHDGSCASSPPGGRPSGAAGQAPAGASEPFSASQRPAENCATFYFRHADTDTEEPRWRAEARGARRAQRSAGVIGAGAASDQEEYLSPAWPESDSDWLNNSGLDDSDLDAIGFATAQEILSELGDHDRDLVQAAAGPGDQGLAAEVGAESRSARGAHMAAAPCDSEIHRLVERAESMVRADLRRTLPPLDLDQQGKAKGRRVREWLKRQHGRRLPDTAAGVTNGVNAPPTGNAVDVSGQVTDSSCDASGEYTSESELETTSSVSEDALTCSMVTCHELATPTHGAGAQTSPTHTLAPPTGSPDTVIPRVVLRNKKRRSGERPWSLHGLNSAQRLRTAPLSVSETALNEMLTPTNDKGVTSSSSNTTVSAGAFPKKLPNSASFDSPFWSAGRRRSRVQRASPAHSSGSEAGGRLTQPGSSPGHRRRRSLRSLESDGESRHRYGNLNAADAHRSSLLSCATEATLVEVATPRTVDTERSPREPDVGEGLAHAAEEASSVSEQSWDPYQELKEVTELGSEGSVDRDAVLRLLDCDDYRNFIDSHSDCASSAVSSVARAHQRSPLKRGRRKPRALSDSLDSDSDSEGLHGILEESRRNLALVQAELERRAGDADAIYSGIVATCRSELNRLEQVRILVDPFGLSRDPDSPCYKPELNQVTGVIQKWETLRSSAMEHQRSADAHAALRERIRSFRHALNGLDERASGAGRQVASEADLLERINALKDVQEELSTRRAELVKINTSVHEYVSTTGSASSNGGVQELANGGSAAGDMKQDVATLYRIWDDVHHRTRTQLDHLTSLQHTWQAFATARAELAQALRADKQKLGVLRQALQTGGDVGARVQDVARVLTERARPQHDVDGTQATVVAGRMTATPDELSEGGTSGYDSAASDDLSERERRLGRLRRMARDLELIVSPSSAAWTDISHTLTTAQSELRELQQTCRDLVIQTTEKCRQQDGSAGSSPMLRRKSYTASRKDVGPMGGPGSDGGPGGRRGWLWRVLRAALPFQLALVLCFCVACLLEPHCCDNLNNLSNSLTPQLRYVRGPPPI